MHLIRFVPDLAPRHSTASEIRSLLVGHSLIVYAGQIPRERARQPDGLMIATVFGGTVLIRLGKRLVAVPEGSYLVANPSRIRAIEPCSTFGGEFLSVFPHRGIIQGAMSAERDSLRPRLSDPRMRLPLPRFVEAAQPHDDFVSPHLHALRQAIKAGPITRAFAENVVSAMVGGLIRRDRALEEEAARIPRLRRATRAEMFSRLQRARELMNSGYGHIRSLTDVASVASMSYAHFNRFFSACYGITPHRYLTERRLEVARRELGRNELSITEISHALGFNNVNSFTALFHRRFGLLPSEFRRGVPIPSDRLSAPRRERSRGESKNAAEPQRSVAMAFEHMR